jgi:sporulation protein YtfJ
MAELDNLFQKSLDGFKNMVDSDTVIGTPIETADGTTVIPFSRVSFGYGIGGIDGGESESKSDSMYGGSGGGVTMQPLGFLIISKGEAKMIRVDETSTADKLLALVPDALDALTEVLKK